VSDHLINQALAAYESAAEVTETALSAYDKLVEAIPWNEITEDQRTQLKDWHEALQKAVKEIRNP